MEQSTGLPEYKHGRCHAMSGQVLRRPRDERVIAGVLGGIAQYYGLPPTRVRIAFGLGSVLLAGFPGIVIYIVLWLAIPSE
jgi:phage shock protein C